MNAMKAIAALAALVTLSACASTLQSAYDEQARTQCERETRGAERGACLDRVDAARQARRD